MSFKLHEACKQANYDLVKQLANNQNIYQLNGQGLYPLDIAIYSYDCCKHLLETLKADPFKRNAQGMNAAACAIVVNEMEIFQMMMTYKDKYTRKSHKDLICETICSNDGLCPIDLVVKHNQVFSQELLKIMFGYISDHIDEKLCRRLLFGTLKYDNFTILKYLITENKETKKIIEQKNLLNWHINLNVSKYDQVVFEDANMTPLIYAISSFKRQLIELLLSNPTVDVNLPNEPVASMAPLHTAVMLNDFDTVKTLLDKGANKLAVCNSVTPLHAAIVNRNSYKANGFNNTDAKKNYEIIRLLAKKKKDIHELHNGFCCLDYAVMNELRDVIHYFVFIDGDLYKFKNGHNFAPIDYASDEFRAYLKKNYKN